MNKLLAKMLPAFLFLILVADSRQDEVTTVPPTATTPVPKLYPITWPDYCCKLSWEKIGSDGYLPKNFIEAGNIGGQPWAYAMVVGSPYMYVLQESPINKYMYNTASCSDMAGKTESYILTNPNKCKINWYKKRYEDEVFNATFTGHLFKSGQEFAPSVANQYFLRYINSSDQIPGVIDTDYRQMGTFCPNETTFKFSMFEILTVDCLKSLVSMSDAELTDISFPADPFPKSKSDVTYFHRSYKNFSPQQQRQQVGFTVERRNKVQVSLSESYASSRCDSDSSSFDTHFGYSAKVSASAKALFVKASFSSEISAGFDTAKANSRQACSAESKNMSSSNVHEEVKNYSFNDEITIPPFSVTDVTAFTNPFQGTIPYRMTYKLSPLVDGTENHEIIMKGIKFFKMADQLDMNGTSVLVHFDGSITIDSGYEVAIDVVSTPLSNSSMLLD